MKNISRTVAEIEEVFKKMKKPNTSVSQALNQAFCQGFIAAMYGEFKITQKERNMLLKRWGGIGERWLK